jgi:hypothetical protein
MMIVGYDVQVNTCEGRYNTSGMSLHSSRERVILGRASVVAMCTVYIGMSISDRRVFCSDIVSADIF